MLWVTEAANGHRQMFETGCDAAPDTVTDAEALAGFAADMRADFAESGNTHRTNSIGLRATILRWHRFVDVVT